MHVELALAAGGAARYDLRERSSRREWDEGKVCNLLHSCQVWFQVIKKLSVQGDHGGQPLSFVRGRPKGASFGVSAEIEAPRGTERFWFFLPKN